MYPSELTATNTPVPKSMSAKSPTPPISSTVVGGSDAPCAATVEMIGSIARLSRSSTR
jgi:hypothetical protein